MGGVVGGAVGVCVAVFAGALAEASGTTLADAVACGDGVVSTVGAQAESSSVSSAVTIAIFFMRLIPFGSIPLHYK